MKGFFSKVLSKEEVEVKKERDKKKNERVEEQHFEENLTQDNIASGINELDILSESKCFEA